MSIIKTGLLFDLETGQYRRGLKQAGAASKTMGRTFRSQLKGMQSSVGALTTRLLSMRNVIAGALVLRGFRILKNQVTGMLDAYGRQELAEKKVATALKSTRGAAGLTAQAMKEYATALQKVTAYGDEEILEAEALMATFTKVKKEVFKEGIELSMDMATAIGTDLRQQVIQLGKALNDPILGVTALRRVGVMLTAQQTEQVKTLIEQNDLFGAQQIILKELRTEFGGMARAELETFSGKMKNIKGRITDVKEAIGKQLAPAMLEMYTNFNKWLEANKDWIALELGEAFKEVAEHGGKVLEIFLKSAPAAIELATALMQIVGPLADLAKWLNDIKALIPVLLAIPGIKAGASIGGAIGTAIAPGVGTGIGGIVGGIAGGAAAYLGGRAIHSHIDKKAAEVNVNVHGMNGVETENAILNAVRPAARDIGTLRDLNRQRLERINTAK